MTPREILKFEFGEEDDTFMFKIRCELTWDWDSFRRLVGAMYEVADEVRADDEIERWIAEGFWYCDWFIAKWTTHPNFPRPNAKEHENAIELIHDLAWFLFFGESPYTDDALMVKLKNL